MDPAYDQQYGARGPGPHPYLHDPVLYITNVPLHIKDEQLATAFVNCGPFRPRINRDHPIPPGLLSGTIEFKFLEKGEIFAF